MPTRRCSSYARGRPWARAWGAALSAALLVACQSAAEKRELIEATDLGWRQEIPDDSHEDTLELMRELRGAEGPQALVTAVFALGIALESPSTLMRAEALRTAWRLAAPLPVEEPRPPALELETFQRTLSELQAQLEAGPAADGAEAARLARRLCTQRFPQEQLNLALHLAELATKPGRWDALPQAERAFAEEAPGVVRHAASLATLRAAEDRADVVREEAYRAIPHLHPRLGVLLAASALERELDGQRLLVLLDGIAHHADELSRDDWRELVDLLQRLVPDVDVGVNRRLRELTELRP